VNLFIFVFSSAERLDVAQLESFAVYR